MTKPTAAAARRAAAGELLGHRPRVIPGINNIYNFAINWYTPIRKSDVIVISINYLYTPHNINVL